MLRLVIDTNILISALIRKDTTPFYLYRAWREGRFELLTSQAQLDEIERVMGYARLQRYFSPEEAWEMLTGLVTYANRITHLPVLTASPDPDDNVILATAVAGAAHCVVSGDKSGMLALGQVENIPVITARHALDMLEAEDFRL